MSCGFIEVLIIADEDLVSCLAVILTRGCVIIVDRCVSCNYLKVRHIGPLKACCGILTRAIQRLVQHGEGWTGGFEVL